MKAAVVGAGDGGYLNARGLRLARHLPVKTKTKDLIHFFWADYENGSRSWELENETESIGEMGFPFFIDRHVSSNVFWGGEEGRIAAGLCLC